MNKAPETVKNTLIIGGGSGMRSYCLSFAEQGWSVVVAGRSISKLENVASKLSERAQFKTRSVDVGMRSSVESLFDWFEMRLVI